MQPLLDLQPTLHSPALTLRPLRADDFDALYAVGGDPLVWEQHPYPDRWQTANFRVFFDRAIESRGALAAIERTAGAVIGTSRFYGFEPSSSLITIGYTFLGRRWWGGAWNREMKRLMLEHAFQSVDRAEFQIGELNRRSRRAVEKIGARLRELRPMDGKSYSIYELSREEFRSGLGAER